MSKKQDSTEGTELVPIGDEGEVAEVKRWIMALPRAEGDEDASDRIMERILGKTDAESILSPDSAEGLRDHVGEQLVIHDARWSPSTVNKKLGAFLLLDVELVKTGDRVVMTTGANNVVAQIVAAYTADLLPLACRVTETPSKTDPTNKIQWLVGADAF
jgi:hypothetical protein